MYNHVVATRRKAPDDFSPDAPRAARDKRDAMGIHATPRAARSATRASCQSSQILGTS